MISDSLNIDRRKMLLGGTGLLLFTLLFGIRVNNIFIFTTLGLWLITLPRQFLRDLVSNRILLFLALLFIVHAASIVYSDNKSAAMSQIEKMLPLLLFPVIFATLRGLDERETRWLKMMFSGGTLAACAYCYVHAAVDSGSFYSYPEVNYYIHPFGRIGYSEYLDVDPTYISSFIVISLLFNLQFFKGADTWLKVVLVIVQLFFLFNLVILASKGPLLALGVVLVLMLFLLKIRPLYSAGMLITMFLAAYFLVTFNTQIRHRIFGEYQITVDHRFGQLRAGSLIALDNPLLGVGVGDTDDVLIQQYTALGDTNNIKEVDGKIEPNNPHNQYLSILVATGIAGFSAFMAGYFLLLQKLLRNKHYIDALVMVTFLICFLFESMLERRQGVLSFTLIYCLLASVKTLGEGAKR